MNFVNRMRKIRLADQTVYLSTTQDIMNSGDHLASSVLLTSSKRNIPMPYSLNHSNHKATRKLLSPSKQKNGYQPSKKNMTL